MDINVYCFKCNSSLEVVEEYNEGYLFHGVTVKVEPCPDCAAQQTYALDGARVCPECDGAVEFCAMGHYIPAAPRQSRDEIISIENSVISYLGNVRLHFDNKDYVRALSFLDMVENEIVYLANHNATHPAVAIEASLL